MRGKLRRNGTPSLAGQGDAQRTWQSEDSSCKTDWPADAFLEKLQLLNHGALVVAHTACLGTQPPTAARPNAVSIKIERFLAHFSCWNASEELKNHQKKRQKHALYAHNTQKTAGLFAQLSEPECGEGGNQ